jgi:predicted dehydrogenase
MEFHPLKGEPQVMADPSKGSQADSPYAAHRALIADFASAVAAGRAPGVSGREALATQETIAAIMQATPER